MESILVYTSNCKSIQTTKYNTYSNQSVYHNLKLLPDQSAYRPLVKLSQHYAKLETVKTFMQLRNIINRIAYFFSKRVHCSSGYTQYVL
jgi:hypothetical protein